ncbi:hypothetical protein N7528_002186 [Penicillium herquei]|nr:hypothetical protein N7528_002186 [Penicillium herquei]
MVIEERYESTSIKWEAFRTLYGVEPEEVKPFDKALCTASIAVLNHWAAILLTHNVRSFSDQRITHSRRRLINLLRQEMYSEAEAFAETSL